MEHPRVGRDKGDNRARIERSEPTMDEDKTKVARDVEGKVADADLRDVDGGEFTPTYDRSKPRKGTHLYDDSE